ncbi:1,4-dihydroxy-6-naphthoate synthase [uncultured Pseudodesulfovibrio sp.]|uniref:1,4-dihydroxy-6-naphthoate synthase n=1 Tax=uncultured Pseudodesulfovibrio sp. TaxID=2035858 RepID=UPI0029C8D52E|nr:1,4-dihydroxy-6-naphthoate synthase [uncultured Pseudodesulfovibrio sp.]
MNNELTLGYSPCPNDTFIFHALTKGLVPWSGGLSVTLADVEELNGLASRGALDVVKVSTAAAAGILDEYVLLRAGGAMGYGAGPVLVAGEGRTLESLDGGKVAIPGERTTANLIFGLCCREAGINVTRVPMVFDEVMPAVQAGRVDAGVVIHEGRFTFAERGLSRVLDLGAWWEAHTGLPIPLGAIAIKRSLGMDVARRMNEAIRQSLLFARNEPEAGRDYIRENAQELSEEVIRTHIETFVTDYSLDAGEAGVQAVSRLLAEAGCDRKDIFITL